MNEIYERITKLCNEKDITGYRLAKDTGLSPSFLTDLKMGRLKSMSAAKASTVAKYLGVTVEYLLNGDEKTPDAESAEREVLDLSTLSDVQKSAIRAVLRMSPHQVAVVAPMLESLISEQQVPDDQQ